MKLNWVERLVVNNPVRVMTQGLEMLWFNKRAALAAGDRVLEFGCGRGAGARLILRKFRPSMVVAQDLDYEMIRKGREFLTESEMRRISLSVGDAYRMPFGKDLFDAVFSFGVLHHIPDWQTALSEIVRVLKPGGLYFIEELYPGSYRNVVSARLLEHPTENRFESADLSGAMENMGLRLTHRLEFKAVGMLGVAVKEASAECGVSG